MTASIQPAAGQLTGRQHTAAQQIGQEELNQQVQCAALPW